MQAKQVLSDPASSPEVTKTLVVEALIWNKARSEGILIAQGIEVVEEVQKRRTALSNYCKTGHINVKCWLR